MNQIWSGFAWILFGILLVLVGFYPLRSPRLVGCGAIGPRQDCSVGSLAWWCFWAARTKIEGGGLDYADFSRH